MPKFTGYSRLWATADERHNILRDAVDAVTRFPVAYLPEAAFLASGTRASSKKPQEENGYLL